MDLHSTENSKAGPSWAIPPALSCHWATEACRKACYGQGFTYNSEASKGYRENNYAVIVELLQFAISSAAKALIPLVDRARPVNGTWTYRIHDLGDFFSVDYIRVWIEVAKARPECSFWFYTRAYVDSAMFEALTELASLPNCRGWLSIDLDNAAIGVARFFKNQEVWSLALMQTPDMDESFLFSLSVIPRNKLIVFPFHKGTKISSYDYVKENKIGIVCPEIQGKYQKDKKDPPCRKCKLCLK